ncbi:hypothetical protein [Pedobacter changchengzhani]|uniref:hypothetical protein n=1 Tax=Pedobacter changchengzhani TaxID=2529274 RepID=UPI00140544BC|nr:hypothetical protein [Pedobacter changchengzhani]
MNKLFTLIILCFTVTSFAQESAELNGYFKESYRTVQLSKQTQRVLFVKTKGNVIIPRSAYYLNLLPADAEKLGLKDILVISDSGKDYVQSDTKLQKVNVMRLSNLENDLFIDVSKKKALDEKMISVLKNPKKTDTLQYNSFYNDNDFGLTKLWIDAVDNNDSITLESVMEIELSNGENISQPTYSLIPINKMAKDALHYVENLFDLGETEDWTKTQWQNWYAKTLNEKLDVEPLKNNKTVTISDNFKGSFPNVALYGRNDSSQKILAVETLRYNIDDFEGHQIIQWDNAKVHKSDYFRPDQKQLFRIDGFKSMGDDLFVIGKSNTWTHLKLDANPQQYNIQKQLIIALPETLNVKGENEISLVQMGEKLSYVILKNNKSESFIVVTLNTITGEVLFAKKLTALLPMVKEKNLSFVYLKYGTEIPGGFLFGIREDKAYHLVKASVNLSEVKVMETTSMIQNSTAFVQGNKLDIINVLDGFLRRISYDASLDRKLNELQVVDFKDKYYDEDGTITLDGKNYQVFFPYHFPLQSGVKMHTLNDQFKLIKSQSVFYFLQVEEPMDDNMLHLLYASKLENNFWLFFKMGNDLRYTKFMENTKYQPKN